MTSATSHCPTDLAGFDPTSNAGECIYDADRAERAVSFFPDCLVHVKGEYAGEPFVLEDWQADIVRTCFGWIRPDGNRRFRRAYVEVPRKNGKSTLLAGILLYLLVADGEEGAEIYCAASDRDQAAIVHSICSMMVERSKILSKRCKVLKSKNRIIHGHSFIRAIPCNEGGTHGFDGHAACVDEVHAIKNQPFYDALMTSFGSRRQPLAFQISTAGWDRRSLCWREHQYAARVRDGKIDDQEFLPVLYSAGEGDDWRDPEVWKRANPNYGRSVKPDFIAAQCKRAQEEPSFENSFRMLHLCQWVSQAVRFLSIEAWRSCKTENDLEPGDYVFGGLDLSCTTDITAFCLAKKTLDGYVMRWKYWIPEDRAREIEKRDKVPYLLWQKQGHIFFTPGTKIEQRYVLAEIMKDVERYNVASIGFDPYNADWLASELTDAGVTMVQIKQGYQGLSAATKELEALVLAQTLEHNGDPVIDWMAENVDVKTQDSNIRPVKPDYHSSAKKIDGIVAAIMAIDRAMNDERVPPSVYETRGPIMVDF